ncbi:MAG: calcium/sodium antiporter [Acidobacteriota bacterium]|nr:calcium/sodium antiporter [Acidobacteriota bacterium]MDH3523932.1 calcium/sodium antiporter [Acidobacteriota bacterium]
MDVTALMSFLAGLAALILGADLLVRGASRMARRLAVSPLAIGLTVVAFGTSAPELAVSLRSALVDRADLAMGNVVGSNVFNVLLILGASSLVRPLAIERKLVRLDVPLMIALSALVWILALDGRLSRWEGGSLFAGVLAYTTLLLLGSRREARARATESGTKPAAPRLSSALIASAAGLLALVFGARWLVAGSVAIARALGLSELVIGLTLVAAGTSLPEAATSIVAALRGERDLAVGNIVGSNVFNLLAVLGGSAVLAPHGLEVSASLLRFDLPVMVGAAVVCLPVFFTGWHTERWEGALLVACYGLYVACLVLGAAASPRLPPAIVVMLGLALPLTGATLLQAVLRARR